MADIRVERKERSIWPWVIGLIVLALIVWAVIAVLNRDETPERPTSMQLEVHEESTTVAPFVLRAA